MNFTNHKVSFIVRVVRGEPDISVQELCGRHGDNGGLSDEEAADDVLQVLKMGYIASGPVTLTPEGQKWLDEGN